MRSFSARLDEQRKVLGNSEKTMKISDETSIEKFNFLFLFFYFFRKFVTKNRAFGNNTIFLQQFFRFRGEGKIFPLSPWLRPCVHLLMIREVSTD